MSRPRNACGLLLVPLLVGCSLVRSENRRTLNLLDENLAPVATGWKVALAPVAFPVGVAGFAADLAVVHPIATIDDAWLDTRDLLWTPRDESPLRRTLFVPVALVATPFVFVGDWFGRWLLPIQNREAPQEQPGKQEKQT